MTTPVVPLASLLGLLVDCACEQLGAAGRPVCDCCLMHDEAQLPQDGCDCGCDNGTMGRLSARVVEILPMDSAVSTTTGPCASAMIQATLELGVFRCITVPDPTAAAVDCDIATAEAIGFLHDAMILRAAVACCDVSGVRGRWQVYAGSWIPRGPEGGCAGGVLTVTAEGLQTFPSPLKGVVT